MLSSPSTLNPAGAPPRIQPPPPPNPARALGLCGSVGGNWEGGVGQGNWPCGMGRGPRQWPDRVGSGGWWVGWLV
jgi:hypothetical protein